MIPISTQIIDVLLFLLPGFMVAEIFYLLTARPKPNTFERIVQALIFTVAIRAIIWILTWAGSPAFWTDQWGDDVTVTVSVMVAFLLGLGLSYASNKNVHSKCLRSLGAIKTPSHPSEWYSAFSRNANRWVILHMKDERRIYGWPVEWPGEPDKGHFLIEKGIWLVHENRPLPPPLGSPALVPASEVNMVEFISGNDSME